MNVRTIHLISGTEIRTHDLLIFSLIQPLDQACGYLFNVFFFKFSFIFNFLFHNSHDKFDRQIIVSNQINQIES